MFRMFVSSVVYLIEMDTDVVACNSDKFKEP